MSLESLIVGVLGAGQMGRGITVSCLLAGYKIFLYDKQTELLKISLGKIETSLKKIT